MNMDVAYVEELVERASRLLVSHPTEPETRKFIQELLQGLAEHVNRSLLAEANYYHMVGKATESNESTNAAIRLQPLLNQLRTEVELNRRNSAMSSHIAGKS